MTFHELSDLINKYQSIKPEEVERIYKDISDIVRQLRSIKRHISFKLRELVDSDTIDDDIENELLQDSKILRNHINSISSICKTVDINNDSHQIKGQLSLFENINLYLCYDDICPACNWKMHNRVIQYKNLDKNANHNISIYECENCNRLFISDYELENIRHENTNIVIHNNYAIKNELDSIDVIVLTSVTRCISVGHNITDIHAKIPTITSNGKVVYVEKDIAYCRECQNYIMLKADFDDIESVVICQVIDQTISYTALQNYDEIEFTQKQSILYQYGYNVSARDNLSSKQRHYILATVIESEILTKSEVLSHLDTLIERGAKIPKWRDATTKWKQDRYYVFQYNRDNLPEILVKRVIKKYHKKIEQ